MKQSKPIIMLGDIHGELNTLKYHITTKNITDCHLIQVGDFGVGYYKLEQDKKNLNELNSFLKKRNIFMYVIRGNHDCLSKKYRVLTKRGWVKYNELTYDDYVLSFNIKTKKSEWGVINDIIIRKSDTINQLSSQQFKLAVTDNHRHLLEDKLGNYYFKENCDLSKSKDKDKFSKVIRGAKINNVDFDISNDILKIISWIMTDGWEDKGNYLISQSKINNVIEIRNLLTKLNVNYGESIRDRSSKEIIIKGKTVKNAKTEYVFRLNKKFSDYISDNYLPNKFLLPSWVYDLSYEQLNVFTKNIILANGSKIRDTDNYNVYGRKEILEQFQPLFSMCGYRSTLTMDNRGDFRLNITHNNKTNILHDTKNQENVTYNDDVFCVTTPLSNFFVELDGHSYFTGNCPSFYNGEHLYSNLSLLPDYTTAVIEGKRFLFVGGAISIDRKPSRIKFLTKGIKQHWEDEVFEFYEEKTKLFIPGSIDVLVTHTCGSKMMDAMSNARVLNPTIVQSFALKYNDDTLIEELELENKKVQDLIDILPNLEQHFFGHYHNSFSEKIGNINHKLLDIFEFYEFRVKTITTK